VGEYILAVPANVITQMEIPEGATKWSLSAMKQFIWEMERHLVIEDRDKLEGNPDFRQIIPYIILQYNKTYFSAVRTKEGGDSRLHGKRIIGFGGHANWIDVPSKLLATQLKLNAQRELTEELIIKDAYDIFFGGFINELTTPVDKDHIGIYIKVDLASPSVYINETSVLVDSGFLDKHELYKSINELENWSKAILGILE
jgi:predicted NUDIX family phosphoesterase